MRTNAIAVANYFVSRYNTNPDEQPHPLDLLRIVKYVYISYGFALAVLNRCIIDPRFDKVEAWKYGPVIPSVYHSFKYNKSNPIRDMAVVVSGEYNAEDEFVVPQIENDPKLEVILDMVWVRYGRFTSGELVDILHEEGTPWAHVYTPGLNVEIPEETTKLYYSRLFELLSKGKWTSPI